MRALYLAVSCLASTTSVAEMIRYDVAGTVTQIDIYGGSPPISSVVVGDRWSGTLWVELSQADTHPSPYVAWYYDGSYGSFGVGTQSFDVHGGGTTVWNEYPNSFSGPLDAVYLSWYSDAGQEPVIDGNYVNDVLFSFGIIPHEYLIDGSLVSTLNLNGAGLADSSMTISMFSGPQSNRQYTSISGTADTYSATVVPAPPVAWPLTLAFGLLVRFRPRTVAQPEAARGQPANTSLPRR